MRRTVTVVLGLATVLLASACAESYPQCKAFEFGDLESEPRVTDDDASFEDCGRVRVEGPMNAPLVPNASALDCALEHLADGRAMRMELDWGPDAEYSETAVIWSDDGRVAMRWRRVTNDLSLEREARVYQLDAAQLEECRALEDAGERFSCLYEAFDAGELVETCQTKTFASE
ncbi:hypothetical protein [Paraliomyxa miuraensis]|uniref:hypothetical protein n=1 Tax=Paraliomyxa miuraensis TaxID=376150 RepID=UPI00224E91AE|nr:hypothetical protein [Paraliomyxa miuraensis]MCX4242973.1 hypothetical protein [Paraliomyxa miuraensis]